MLLRPGHRGPALLVQDALPRDRVLLARAVAEAHALADLGRQVVADEGAYLCAERHLFRGEAKVHRAVLLLISSCCGDCGRMGEAAQSDAKGPSGQSHFADADWPRGD